MIVPVYAFGYIDLDGLVSRIPSGLVGEVALNHAVAYRRNHSSPFGYNEIQTQIDLRQRLTLIKSMVSPAATPFY